MTPQTLPDGMTANVTVPEGATSGTSFQFVPPVASPVAVAVPVSSAATSIALSVNIPIPDMEEVKRDENVFDSHNGEFVVRTVTDYCGHNDEFDRF